MNHFSPITGLVVVKPSIMSFFIVSSDMGSFSM